MSVTVLQSPAASGFNWSNQIGPMISGLISIAVIVFSYFSTRKTLKVSQQNTEAANKASLENTTKTLNSKRIEEKKEEIYKKLNDFYSPFYQLRAKSQLLYKEFSEKYKHIDPSFRTLTYLLDNGTVTGNEKVLLDQIIEIGASCEQLIHDKAGLIDDEELRTKWFPQASTHYLILRLAYKGSLTGEAEKFKKHTFPHEIDGLVEKRIVALHDELEKLNSN